MRFVKTTVWAAVILAALALPLRADAQVNFGVAAGLSIASLSGDDADVYPDSRSGINVGAFAEFPLGDIIWLSPGVYYVQKGGEREATNGALKIDYIEVPLLLRVAVSQRDPIGVNLFLGPTLAYQAKCDFEVGSLTSSCEDSAGSNFDATKSFDLGLAVGGGLSFALSPGVSLLANALWDLGLMSIDDSPADNDVKNEAILLNVGLLFRPGM
jgi:hypothetical protein